MEHDEQEIIQSLKEGHDSAYKYIYERYYSPLCSFANKYVGDDDASKLLVDELISHLWEKRETLEINTSLQNYLIRAVQNRCADYLKSERKRRESSFSSFNIADEEGVEYLSVSSSEIADSPLDTLLENELKEEVRQAIDNLPAACCEIFKMHQDEGKSYEQIAKEKHLSVNTVKYHIKNAFSFLRKALINYRK